MRRRPGSRRWPVKSSPRGVYLAIRRPCLGFIPLRAAHLSRRVPIRQDQAGSCPRLCVTGQYSAKVEEDSGVSTCRRNQVLRQPKLFLIMPASAGDARDHCDRRQSETTEPSLSSSSAASPVPSRSSRIDRHDPEDRTAPRVEQKCSLQGMACMGITVSRPPTEDRGRAVLQWRTIDGWLPFLAIAKQTVTSRGDAFAGCRDCTATCLYTVGQVSVRNHDAEYASAAAVRGGGSTLPFGADGPCHLNGLPPPRFVGPESRNPGRSPLPDGYCAWWSRTPSGTRPCLAKRQSAISGMRARATISLLRTFLSVPAGARYHVTSALRLVHQHPRQTTDRSSVHPRDHGEQSTSEIPSASNIGSCDDGKQRCLQDGMAGELCE